MPLKKGKSKMAMSSNIRELMSSGNALMKYKKRKKK